MTSECKRASWNAIKVCLFIAVDLQNDLKFSDSEYVAYLIPVLFYILFIAELEAATFLKKA